MAEEFELPETPETPESHKERRVGLIIAAIAVVLAIITHIGNETHQDEILAHVDAADQFSYYQAKRERRAQLELQVNALGLQTDTLPPAALAKARELTASYSEERERLQGEGEKIQEKGNELMAESKKLARKSSVLDIGEIALQIAVVICSISILTEQSLFVRMGVGIALVGVVVAGWALLFQA